VDFHCRERTKIIFNFGFQALSGVDEALKAGNLLDNTALQSALDTQFLLQIGVFTVVPIIVNFILEQGVMRVWNSVNISFKL
jgi:callose synthase